MECKSPEEIILTPAMDASKEESIERNAETNKLYQSNTKRKHSIPKKYVQQTNMQGVSEE